jgi:hypothetical protein
VTDEPPTSGRNENEPIEITTDVAQPARLYDYLAGGEANFTVDRELGDFMVETSPFDIDTARASAKAQHEFMVRAVRYLVTEAGIRQFLNLGTTVPLGKDARAVHEVAQGLAPEARVVYAGHDPVVLAHAHTLCMSTSEGAAAYVHASLRQPQRIVREAGAVLDFDQPMALLLLGVLDFIADEHGPYEIVEELLKATASGSYLVVAHCTNHIRPDVAAVVAERISKVMNRTFAQRSIADVARFFDGLELVEDGLVHIDQWRRQEHEPLPGSETFIPLHAAVGRKP